MDDAEIIKSKIDIVEVISSYLPLKKMGRNFAGLCPFHAEKTPSFMVSPERQAWKCFGCSEGGDVFTFLEKMEGWEFRETLEELAKRVGVRLTNFKPSGAQKVKEKLIEINKKALQFYKYLLNKHAIGETARKYLIARGVTQKFWEKFDLGYAPNGWENLAKFLEKRGYQLPDLATAGLVIARLMAPRMQASGGQGREAKGLGPPEGGYYDRFRNRIIFPLKDGRGTVLGFSGRTLENPPAGGREAKYINSPETPIFNKGSLLFGLDVAREAIRDKNEVVLVEGEFDVISAHKAGVFNVVASKGTALTEKQVAVLSRLAEKVALCFDTDLAGDSAARRGIELLDLAGVTIGVVRLGKYLPSSTAKYKDPDEFAQKDPVGFKKASGEALNVYDYFMESASARYDPKTAEGKKKIGKELLPVLAKISDDLVRAHYVDKLARILDLDVALVAAAVEKKTPFGFSEQGFTGQAGEGGESVKNKVSLEEYFLALFISQDEVVSLITDIAPSDFENEKAGRFWKWFHDIIKASKSKSFKRLLLKLPSDLGSFVDQLYLVNISPIFGEKEIWAQELAKIAQRIRMESFRRRLFGLSRQLKVAQAEGDVRQITILTKRFDQIAKYLKSKEGV